MIPLNTGYTATDLVDVCRDQFSFTIYAVGNDGVVKINPYYNGYTGWITEEISGNPNTYCVASPENRGSILIGTDSASIYLRSYDQLLGVYYYSLMVVFANNCNKVLSLAAYNNKVVGGGENGLLFVGEWDVVNSVWNFTQINITNEHIRTVAIAPVGSDYLVGAFGDNGFNAISDDFFTNYASPLNIGDDLFGSHFCSDGTDVKITLGGNGQDIYQSFNSGANFSTIYFNLFDIQNILAKGTDEIYVCGFNDDEVYKSPDGGINWVQVTVPNSETVKDLTYSATCSLMGVGTSNLAYNEQEVQTLDLIDGWEYYSTYIHPDNPNCWDVFNPVIGNLEIVKNDDGFVFWPSWNNNTIGDLLDGEGYQIKMNFASSLDIIGLRKQISIIELDIPHSIIPYLRTFETDAELIFEQIYPEISIARDGLANIFVPYYVIPPFPTLNQIGNLQPGKGYIVSVYNHPVYINYNHNCGCY
jgi:hypothetical protein